MVAKANPDPMEEYTVADIQRIALGISNDIADRKLPRGVVRIILHMLLDFQSFRAARDAAKDSDE